AASRADLLAALGTEETQQRKLRSLLSDDYSKWENVVIQPDSALVAVPERFNLQESWRKGLAQRPDLLKQRLALEKQGYQVRFSQNQLFPQLDLIGTAGLNASDSTFSGYLHQLGRRDHPRSPKLCRSGSRRRTKETRKRQEHQLRSIASPTRSHDRPLR